MNFFWSIILGAVQGFTEFLPVSSSGHLVIVQKFIPGFSQPGVFFDVVLHLATLCAVLVYFRKRLLSLTFNYYILLLIGTIPAVVIGFLFQDQLEAMFGNYKMVAIELIISGILNILIDRAREVKKVISNSDSFIIGIAQAIAIIPGISRSGATIFAGGRLGIKREEIAEFSFLLSIPAILGAAVLEFLKHGTDTGIALSSYSGGFIAAFIFGLISIKLVFTSLTQRKFSVFGIYCIVLGILFYFVA